MFKTQNYFIRCVVLLALLFTLSSEATAQNFLTMYSKTKDYDYNRYYGYSSAGGSIHLDSMARGRILWCQPHLLIDAKGAVTARKRVRILGKSFEAARLHVDATGQNKSFDESGSTISNIGSKGRFIVDRFIRIGGSTVYHPSPYKKEFTSASQVWPTAISKTYAVNFYDFHKTVSFYGIPVTFGVRVGGGSTLSLGVDLDPFGTRFLVQVYGEARAYGFASSYGYLGGPGLGAGPELECQFMQIRVRPHFDITHNLIVTPRITVTRTVVDLYAKVCAQIGWGWASIHPCATLFNYSKGSNSWTATLK